MKLRDGVCLRRHSPPLFKLKAIMKNKTEKLPEWMTLKQAGNMIGVSDITIKNWINMGLLTCRRTHACLWVRRDEVNAVSAQRYRIENAQTSIDEAVAKLEEKKAELDKEIEEIDNKRRELNVYVADKRKIEKHFNWFMDVLENTFLAFIRVAKYDDTFRYRMRHSDVIVRLLGGETLNSIAENLGIKVCEAKHQVRQSIENIICLTDLLYEKSWDNDYKECIINLQKELDDTKAQLSAYTTPIQRPDIYHDFHSILDRDIDLLPCGCFQRHWFYVNGVKTIRDIIQMMPEDVLKVRNVGRKRVREIEEALKNYDLRLGMTEGEIREYIDSGADLQLASDDDMVRLLDSQISYVIPYAKKYWKLNGVGLRRVIDLVRLENEQAFVDLAHPDNQFLIDVITLFRKNGLRFGMKIKDGHLRLLLKDLYSKNHKRRSLYGTNTL